MDSRIQAYITGLGAEIRRLENGGFRSETEREEFQNVLFARDAAIFDACVDACVEDTSRLESIPAHQRARIADGVEWRLVGEPAWRAERAKEEAREMPSLIAELIALGFSEERAARWSRARVTNVVEMTREDLRVARMRAA